MIVVLGCALFLAMALIIALVLWFKESYESHVNQMHEYNRRQAVIIDRLADRLAAMTRPGAASEAMSAGLAKEANDRGPMDHVGHTYYTNQHSSEKMPLPDNKELNDFSEVIMSGEMTPEDEARWAAGDIEA